MELIFPSRNISYVTGIQSRGNDLPQTHLSALSVMKNPNKSAFGVILDSLQLFSEGEIRMQYSYTGTGLTLHNVEVNLILTAQCISQNTVSVPYHRVHVIPCDMP